MRCGIDAFQGNHGRTGKVKLPDPVTHSRKVQGFNVQPGAVSSRYRAVTDVRAEEAG